MKVKRFYYVGNQADGAIHRAERLIEGSRMWCGRRIGYHWAYWLGLARVPKNRSICAGCAK